MSDENRLQLEEFLNGLFDENLKEINENRNLSIPKYKLIADSLLAVYPTAAKQVGIVDELKYYDEVLAEIKTRCGLNTDDELKFVGQKDYRTSFTIEAPESSDRDDAKSAQG